MNSILKNICQAISLKVYPKKSNGLSVRRTMLSAKRLSAKTISAQRNILWPIRWSFHWRKSHFPNGFPCMKTGRFHHNITRLFTRLSNEPVNLPLLIKKSPYCVAMKRFGLLPCNYRYLLSDFWISEWDEIEWTESVWHLANWVSRMRDQKNLYFSTYKHSSCTSDGI